MPWIEPVDAYAQPPRLPKHRPSVEPWTGEVHEGLNKARLDSVSIDGSSLDAGTFPELELLDSQLTGVVLETSGDSRLDLVDSMLTNCDLSRARLGSVRGTSLVGCKLAGTDFSGEEVRDTVLESCSLQFTNMRMSVLDRVEFRECVLDDTDFYEATLSHVTFQGTALTEVNIDRASFDRVDFRGARSLGLNGTIDLHGCLISDSQVQQLAYALALAAGATLERDAE